MQAVVAALPELVWGGGRAGQLERAAVPRALARRVGVSDAAVVALPAVELGARRGVDPVTVAGAVRGRRAARARQRSGTASACCRGRPVADRGPGRAARRLLRVGARAHRRSDPRDRRHVTARRNVDAWIGAHLPAVERYARSAADVERAGVFDLASLAVLRRALRELADLD